MRDKINKYLFDIEEAIDSIYSYLGEKRDFGEYQKNKQLSGQLKGNWRS